MNLKDIVRDCAGGHQLFVLFAVSYCDLLLAPVLW